MDTKWFGRPAWEVIAWIILVIIILWAIKQEYRESHCYDGVADCGAVWQWEPREGDTDIDLLKRLEYGNRGEAFVISRRLVMITAAGLTLLVMWYFDKKKRVVPNIVEYLVPFALIMGVVWWAFRYHESHYLYEIARRQNLTIQELKYRMGAAVRPPHVN
jgi:uncharacterized membrane protein YqjE